MSDVDKRDHRDWAIYLIILLGVVFLVSSILYVINSEQPVESPVPTPSITTPSPTTEAPPTSPPTTTPSPTTPPPTTEAPTVTPSPTPSQTKQKITWDKRVIETEMGDYVSDGRIGVQVRRMYDPEAGGIAVEVLFKNKTENTQPFNLKNINLFFYKSKEEYIKDRVRQTEIVGQSFETGSITSVFDSLRGLNESVKEIPPNNGLIIVFYFERSRWQPDHLIFENYYYEDLEYTQWSVKVRY